jgi:hypothetical protein
MQAYPIDIDPEQVVRWIRAEHQAAPSAFTITARRAIEVKEIPLRREIHLGDEEREDLSEVATVATLEIAPAHTSDGWLLTVVVENEVAPHVPETSKAVEPEQGIDLGTFYHELIRPGGTANVTAEVEDQEAEARVTDLLDRIERNYHGPARPSDRRSAEPRSS